MPALLEANLETLRPPGNPDELVCVGYRPVFKEHVNRAGKKIGQRELSGITSRCNERILDTEDFAPLVIRHTRDGGDFDPKVIGFVGPYRMSKLGNRKPLPAIEGKVWVFRKHLEALKDYPRLSVEFWADENDPGNGYFDPISLLGAETPELDLGVHYAKDDATGRQLMRYSKVERFQAVVPGGANTSVPSLIESDKEKKTSYGESGEMQFTTESLQQLVAALKPVMEQLVDERMASFTKSPTDADDYGSDDLDLEGDADLDIGDDLDGMDELADEDGEDFSDDDLPPEIDGEESDMGLGDDADLEDVNEPPGGDGAAEEIETPVPSAEDEDEEEMTVADKKKPEQFARQPGEMTLQQYAKENAALRERYHKAEARATKAEERIAVLEGQVGEIRAEKVKAQRYAKLNDLLNAGYVLTIDDELKDTEPLNDEQFGRHCDKIVQRYARVPIGQAVFIPPSPQRDGSAPDEKRERYSKAAQEKTLELREKGHKVEFETVLANISANEGKYVPAA